MEYLPISKAVEIYKISKTSLTRLANKNINSVSVKKENGMFLISVELLDEKYEKRVSSLAKETEHTTEHVRTISRTRANTSEPKKDTNENEVVNLLKSENEFLKKEVGNKQKTIDTLLQRQSEQNIIIQTLNNKIETLSNKVESSVPLLIEAVKENKPVTPVPADKSNDNGFTIASAIMIILLVVMIVVYLTVK